MESTDSIQSSSPENSVRTASTTSEAPSSGVHTSPSSDDEVLYQGRKVPRSTRLKQMRESQKLLRDKRRNKVKALEDENKELKLEIKRYREFAALNCAMSDPLFRYYPTRFFPEKVEQLNVKFVKTNNAVGLRDKPFDKVNKLYMGEGKNVTTYILESTSKMIKEKDNLQLKRTVFRFIPTIELALTYVEYLETYLKSQSIPEHWSEGSRQLPDGVISLFEVVDYLLAYTDLLRMSMEVFATFAASLSFATHWGPGIFVFDLSTCVKAAINPMYDAALLHNVLEKQVESIVGSVCETGEITASAPSIFSNRSFDHLDV
ncbi:uncharacterized protein CANTADRAFT_24683 [Suhomyces tanzawaensis NRRL Y-17324]|uniref:BZIP domain-containing protein n=1 Tax=Suhomyces tanzawaensis NRRL Y-17324 TaxID=984487 RepID=A0A1E4SRE2_9ASCO|nr:uncharacterized protein CANTADRAFT_24683 [Suhomyces tanzawaensis NRRL Y-17324]ODV81972.1 hypothetical protein CANTADRAFT_24683 [Suhomyces tanzawaensis NRRL Y-17324]